MGCYPDRAASRLARFGSASGADVEGAEAVEVADLSDWWNVAHIVDYVIDDPAGFDVVDHDLRGAALAFTLGANSKVTDGLFAVHPGAGDVFAGALLGLEALSLGGLIAADEVGASGGSDGGTGGDGDGNGRVDSTECQGKADSEAGDATRDSGVLTRGEVGAAGKGDQKTDGEGGYFQGFFHDEIINRRMRMEIQVWEFEGQDCGTVKFLGANQRKVEALLVAWRVRGSLDGKVGQGGGG